MRRLPRTRSGVIRLTALVGLLAGLLVATRVDRPIAYALSAKAEGDILLQSLPHGALVDAIEGVTRSEWSHCGVLIQRDGRWEVAEAIGEVRTTPLALWLLRGRGHKVEAWRLKNPPSPEALHAALQRGLVSLLGRPYDFRYAPEDDAIYCSELVHKLYERELGVVLGRWERLGDLNWRPHEAFVRQMENGALPLDRVMVTPVGLTRSPLVERVFP